MPLHDWRDDRGWNSLHIVWQAQLLDWIQPRLPAGYRAYLGSVPALTIDAPNGRPDLGVRQWPADPPGPPDGSRPPPFPQPGSEAGAGFEVGPPAGGPTAPHRR